MIDMSVKQEAVQALNALRDTATWEDAIYTLYVKQKVMRGLQDVREGNTFSHEDAKNKLIVNAS